MCVSVATKCSHKSLLISSQVIHEMGEPYSRMELASFVTCSKGWAAECGLRAGFLELVGLQREVAAAFARTRALRQCPGVLGQCALHCIVSLHTGVDEKSSANDCTF